MVKAPNSALFYEAAVGFHDPVQPIGNNEGIQMPAYTIRICLGPIVFMILLRLTQP